MIKRMICAMMAAAIMVSSTACTLKKSNADTADTVVAIVGETKITLGDMEGGIKSIEEEIVNDYGEDYASNEEAMADFKQQKNEYLDYIVEGEIVGQKAEEMGITADDDEIDTELESLKEQFDSEEAYNTALEQSGMTIAELRQQLAENIKINKVIDELFKDIQVTDEEIKQYYDSNESVQESTLEDATEVIRQILEQDKQQALYEQTMADWKEELKVQVYYDLL